MRRYRRQLLAYCRRIGSPGTNAEDTLQQALLQAWTAIRTGVEVRDPRAWLYRIVHNVAITNQRRPALIPVELRDTAGTNGADDEAEQRMAARDALAGLAALPDLQREVMVGTAVDGLSHEQLATALGLSSGAVRGLIYRARATLRAAAAAILPGPVISWSLRSGTGHSAGLYEALGGGSAGIGGLLIKGGAVAATAGAIATATGISTSHKAVHHRSTTTAATGEHRLVHAQPTASTARSTRLLVVDPTSSHAVSPSGAGQRDRHSGSAARGAQSSAHRSSDNGFLALSGKPSSGKGHHRTGSDGGDHGGTSGGGGRPSGHDGSNGGSSSGHDGSSSAHDGSGSGSGPDGSHSGSGSGTLSGGSGGDHSGALSGSDGGGSGGGGHSVSTDGSTGTTTSTGDDRGDSGSSTTTTTTPTTVPTIPTVTAPGDDGSNSGHRGGN